MHQRDHFVCLYLKTWRVRFLLFPSPISFQFQNFVNSGPAQFQQVQQKIIGCRTYVLHIEFFPQKVWNCIFSFSMLIPPTHVSYIFFCPFQMSSQISLSICTNEYISDPHIHQVSYEKLNISSHVSYLKLSPKETLLQGP